MPWQMATSTRKGGMEGIGDGDREGKNQMTTRCVAPTAYMLLNTKCASSDVLSFCRKRTSVLLANALWAWMDPPRVDMMMQKP